MKHWGLFVISLCACNSTTTTTALHDLHQSSVRADVPSLHADFYTLPFPNDLRMGTDGTIDLTLYPRLGGLLGDYVDTFDARVTGFGTNAATYFRFDGAIDPGSLPQDPNGSVDASASAFIVDVTPSSPTFGKRTPLTAHFVKDAYQFIGPYWLALLPFPGIPLREKTTYAAVLTDGIKAAGGGPVLRDADFNAALQNNAAASGDPNIAAAAKAYAPFTSWLASQPGLAAHVINATVFTTVDATSVMGKLRAAVYAQAPAPVLAGMTAKETGATYQVYEGTYMGPNFQSGVVPYASSGGDIKYDSSGMPIMDHLENLRVAMSIPTGAPMPAAGWPVVIYAHGTGGDYRSFLDAGDHSGQDASLIKAADGTEIARMAMISIDQVLHGTRSPAGTNYDLAFFNFPNPAAGVDNVKQGALDDFQLLRLIKSMGPTAGLPFAFDPTKIYFKGHSQGGLTGPLFLAAEPEVKAAILSGAGGVLILSLLNKTQPVDITKVVGALFQDPVDQFHPMLSLVQTFFEPSEPTNYARLLFREPPMGFAPKSIFQSLGLVDTYAPVPDIKALGLAMGVQPVNPIVEPSAMPSGNIDGLDLVGQTWGTAPVVGNAAGGAATSVLLEYAQAGSSDGHFVIFDVPAADHQCNRFLATHAATGVARLDPP
ncbi:MAG TPA: hypothetical protein VFF06_20675 [Polyangia bacterium]|nr:hypothetical protein [Polyangia bacterium]